VLTITYNATSLQTPGLANIITAAGDNAVARSLGSGNWVIESYTPASGLSMVGQIAFFPANAAPGGWLKCSGALVSRATYPALWAFANASGNIVSDAAWSSAPFPSGSFSTGDGSTTFRIPDLRGEFVRGWDDGRGADSGRTIGSYQADALQNHTHEVFDRINAGAGEPTVNGVNSGGSDITRTTTNPVTGRTAAETRPRNVALLACIKF
jgi:microcystin-dependent protein